MYVTSELLIRSSLVDTALSSQIVLSAINHLLVYALFHTFICLLSSEKCQERRSRSNVTREQWQWNGDNFHDVQTRNHYGFSEPIVWLSTFYRATWSSRSLLEMGCAGAVVNQLYESTISLKGVSGAPVATNPLFFNPTPTKEEMEEKRIAVWMATKMEAMRSFRGKWIVSCRLSMYQNTTSRVSVGQLGNLHENK